MAHKAGLKHTRRQGRPFKAQTLSYDMTADRIFGIAGQMALEMEGKTYEERLKALQVLLPIAMKRIPDKVQQLNVNLPLDTELAQRLLAALDGHQATIIQPPPECVTLPEPDADAKP